MLNFFEKYFFFGQEKYIGKKIFLLRIIGLLVAIGVIYIFGIPYIYLCLLWMLCITYTKRSIDYRRQWEAHPWKIFKHIISITYLLNTCIILCIWYILGHFYGEDITMKLIAGSMYLGFILISILFYFLKSDETYIQSTCKNDQVNQKHSTENNITGNPTITKIYLFLKKASIYGIPILTILIGILAPIRCGSSKHASLGEYFFAVHDMTCNVIYGIELSIMLGAVLAGIPFIIIGALSYGLIILIEISNDVSKKILFGIPFWILLFILLASFLGIFISIEYASFFLVIIILCTLFSLKYREDSVIKKISPTSQKLHEILESIDIQDITGIAFQENGGENYIIKLKSIRQIAVYIFQKAGKTTFLPNELVKEKEFLLEYYQSNLRPTEYKKLVSYLDTWVTHGGSFEILKTEKI